MATPAPMSAISSETLRLLVVAGRDSSGGAGVDADLEAARWGGASATVVVTAETLQGERGLEALGAREPSAWMAEAEAALEVGVDAIKIGVLPGSEHVVAAAEFIQGVLGAQPPIPVVVDPVLAPTQGGRFLEEAGVEAFREVLLPTGCFVTPNIDEAAELTGRVPDALREDLEERIAAAQDLMELGAGGVVLKGGHAGGALLDLVCEVRSEPRWLRLERAPGSLRGTGCRHSTCIALGLARGQGLMEAARAAGDWIGSQIAAQDGS